MLQGLFRCHPLVRIQDQALLNKIGQQRVSRECHNFVVNISLRPGDYDLQLILIELRRFVQNRDLLPPKSEILIPYCKTSEVKGLVDRHRFYEVHSLVSVVEKHFMSYQFVNDAA